MGMDSYIHANNSITFMQLGRGWVVLLILHEMTKYGLHCGKNYEGGRKDTAGQTAHKQARCSIHHDQTKLPKAKHKQQELEIDSTESNWTVPWNNNKSTTMYIVLVSC